MSEICPSERWAGHCDTAGPSWEQAKPHTKRAPLPTEHRRSPDMQQRSGRGTRATQRCSTEPTAQLPGAAEQLFPAVLTGCSPGKGCG